MMLFRLFLCEDEDNSSQVAQLDLSLSDSDYVNIARKVKRYIENNQPDDKKNPFASAAVSMLITVLAHENIIAFGCGFLQTKGSKKKLTDFVNSKLESMGMFFRLSDYIIEHL